MHEHNETVGIDLAKAASQGLQFASGRIDVLAIVAGKGALFPERMHFLSPQKM
jgi:hypothetical protein